MTPTLGEKWRAARARLRQPRALATSLAYRLHRDPGRLSARTFVDPPPQPPSTARRLVLFAHFDPQGEIDDYVAYYLERLAALDSVILFVSACPRLRAAAVEKIRPWCAAIRARRNLSLDFGSWRLAWQLAMERGWRPGGFEQIVCANDSVYGPLFPLAELFAAFRGADMYGVTESAERGPHLQSYLLAWDVNPRTTAFLEAFWRRFRYVVLRQDVIDRYEIGISQAATAAGLRLQAFAPEPAVRAAAARRGREPAPTANSSLRLWDVLIEDFRCPFIKTHLLRHNPYHSEKIAAFTANMGAWTSYPPALIERNLARLRNPPGERLPDRSPTVA